MKHLIILILAVLPYNSWERSSYDKLELNDFRRYSLFLEEVNTDNIDYGRVNAVVFYLTNEQRVSQGLTELKYHPSLEIAAWHHSRAMAEKSFFDHVNKKDKSRREPGDRGKLAGISNPYLAENIAMHFGKPFDNYLQLGELFVEQWMNSPGHRKNILSENALQMGCGVYYDQGEWLGTQNFQWYEPVKAGPKKDGLP